MRGSSKRRPKQPIRCVRGSVATIPRNTVLGRHTKTRKYENTKAALFVFSYFRVFVCPPESRHDHNHALRAATPRVGQLARCSRCERNGLPGLRAGSLACRRSQLAQDARCDLEPGLAELGDCSGQRATQRRRKRETGEALLERGDPASIGTLGRRGIEQQVLGDAHREPEREDPFAPRPARGARQQLDERGGGWVPAVLDRGVRHARECTSRVPGPPSLTLN